MIRFEDDAMQRACALSSLGLPIRSIVDISTLVPTSIPTNLNVRQPKAID